MNDENGNTYFKEYWNSPPPQLTELQTVAIKIEGERRRKEYIEKHPRETTDYTPAGWEEPLEPKKGRRRT